MKLSKMELCRICSYLFSLFVTLLVIGSVWESHFSFEIQVQLKASLDDVFSVVSDRRFPEKFHPLVYKMGVKDRGYQEPAVRLYELELHDEVPYFGPTSYTANKTVYENRHMIFHKAVAFFGLIKTNVTWSFECADVTDSSKLPDSCLTTVMMETASTTVPILFKAFVEEQQKQSHEDTFKRIKDHFG